MLIENLNDVAVNDNYRHLMCAIVLQACQDYSKILKKSKYDKNLRPHNTSVYRFILDNPYCEVLDIDGKRLIHKMEDNFKKYGKGVLTDREWDEIAKIDKKTKGE